MLQRNYPKIQAFLENRQSLLVLGPRGTGKTYYLGKLIEKFPNNRTIDLLDQRAFERYLKVPSLLYDEIQGAECSDDKPLYLLIDEIQLIPPMLNEVHRCIETFGKKVVFLLTGSSARKLKRDNANLLAGRAIRFDFFPLTLNETDHERSLEKILQWGSLPKVLTESNHDIVVEYLRTYVGTYLREEIQKESEIRKLAAFSRFLELASVENASPVNYAKIGRAAGVSSDTAKQYFQVLVDTLLATEIPAWTYSVKQKLQQASKFYLFDNGVLNALSGELQTELRKATYRYGKLFENMVVNEIIRWNSIEGKDVKLFHYRSTQGQEIDLILQKNPHSRVVAVEIKSGDAPSLAKRSPLSSFKKNYPNSLCVVLCQTSALYEQNGVKYMHYLDGIRFVLNAAKDG